MDALKIEEMEKLLKEAHLEKVRLLESKVSGEKPGICVCEDLIQHCNEGERYKFLNSCGSSAVCVCACTCIAGAREPGTQTAA